MECEDPYAHTCRKVNVKEVQWKYKIWPSCKVGFNAKSRPKNPESDNEMHRIHKHGDDRCISEYSSSQDLKFDCPKCDKEFSCNTQLQSHISQKHAGFELSFPTMLMASEGSISDIYETCKQCGKIFENELDLANHVERVHEYGETF